jgi:hypothetical protein
MKQNTSAETQPVVAFCTGQLWRTEDGCILITEQGEKIIGYRKLRNPQQRAALTIDQPDSA